MVPADLIEALLRHWQCPGNSLDSDKVAIENHVGITERGTCPTTMHVSVCVCVFFFPCGGF